MALSSKDEMLLDTILAHEDVDEAMMYLIKNYAKRSTANAQFLLGTIPGLVDTAIQKMSEFAAMHSQASYWLMCQREMEPDKSGMFFASMVPVCKARFPAGNSDGCCKAERDYFDQFLSLFANKKVFSWEKDRAWADTHGYTEYLKLVEKQMKEGKNDGT